MKHDFTDAIERMPALEARTGTRLEALYGEIEENEGEYDVHLRGEIHAVSGAELSASIDLIMSVYDDKGRIIATTNSWFNNESFFAFETFELSCYGVAVRPERLRVHAKVS